MTKRGAPAGRERGRRACSISGIAGACCAAMLASLSLSAPASAATILWLRFEDSSNAGLDSAGAHTFAQVGPGTAQAGQHVDGTDPSGGVLALGGTAALKTNNIFGDLTFTGTSALTIDLWARSNGARTSIMQMFEFYPSNGSTRNVEIQSNVFQKSSVYWDSSALKNMSTATSVSDGAWHHIAFQRDGDAAGTLRFFVDGVLVDTDSFVGTLDGSGSGGATTYIGVQGPAFYFWNGWLDEVRVSGAALFPTTGIVGSQVFAPSDYVGESVPEPGALYLAAAGLLGLGRRTARGRRS